MHNSRPIAEISKRSNPKKTVEIYCSRGVEIHNEYKADIGLSVSFSSGS
jgi:hypothetical protein